MAKAVPHGAIFDELLVRTIPLDATDVPAGVLRDRENGRQPPYVTAMQLLEGWMTVPVAEAALSTWQPCVRSGVSFLPC